MAWVFPGTWFGVSGESAGMLRAKQREKIANRRVFTKGTRFAKLCKPRRPVKVRLVAKKDNFRWADLVQGT